MMDFLEKVKEGKKVRGRRSLIDGIEVSGGIALIAEIKRRSPSGGVLRKLDAVETAKKMESAGADAISVLTNEEYFGGSLHDLEEVSGAVNIPVLRKDFITDKDELYEAVAFGGDAVLLIAGLLESETKEFVDEAHRIGLECLVEVHGKGDLHYALDSNARLIGVNNRDLSTLKVDLKTAEEIIPFIPGDRIIVAESGINTVEDVKRMRDAGAGAILVGTSVMKAGDLEAKIRELKSAC
jgi:indole-3-glycerol phosphate synthase